MWFIALNVLGVFVFIFIQFLILRKLKKEKEYYKNHCIRVGNDAIFKVLRHLDFLPDKANAIQRLWLLSLPQLRDSDLQVHDILNEFGIKYDTIEDLEKAYESGVLSFRKTYPEMDDC